PHSCPPRWPTAPPAAAPVETGGGRGYAMDQVDTVPSVVGQPRPAYPYRARRRNIEGWVKIRFLVDRNGRVHDLTILSSSPKDVFDAAVREAVPRWRFRAGIKSGRPVDVWVETTIQFKLD
ncbi:energy transducer TonB, partial [Desulfococcus sp.]|uniref:energy transducer TonB n=1 Tax=Desulfococcus sp. TaxID=2025834 RepID=UPI00359449E3